MTKPRARHLEEEQQAAERVKAAKRTRGGPRAEDLNTKFFEQMDAMLEIQCTEKEIAAVLDVNHCTIMEACKRVHGVTFEEYAKEKRRPGNVSLRRAQWEKAVNDGNPTMLIWLGKQYLDQTDKNDLHHAADGGAQPVTIVVQGVEPSTPKKADD